MKQTLVLLVIGFMYGQNINESIINTAVYTGSHIDMSKYNSGWGLPIPMQVSHIRQDGAIPGLTHTTMTDFGFGHSYTYNMPGSQITFENSNKTTFGFSSSQNTRTIHDQPNNKVTKSFR